MRRSSYFCLLTTGQVLVLGAFLLHARAVELSLRPEREQRRALAASLEITDLAIFNEARYTRHPVQADLHSPFQDHPFALEHFPSGSLVPPPPNLAR